MTDADKNSGLFQYSLTGITKVYIDIPRNILTTFDYYANMSRTVTFICNDEEEFLTTYYMVISDYGTVSNDPHYFIALAKGFLEDSDSNLKGGDKLCAYYYDVVNGEPE